MRVVYMRQLSSQTGADKPDSERTKLAFKMFHPVKLPRETNVGGEEELNEGGYEDLGQLQERVNTWLQRVGMYFKPLGF